MNFGGFLALWFRVVPQDAAFLRPICPVNALSVGNLWQDALMQVISEEPTKITKATVDAAWRRRKEWRQAHPPARPPFEPHNNVASNGSTARL